MVYMRTLQESLPVNRRSDVELDPGCTHRMCMLVLNFAKLFWLS